MPMPTSFGRLQRRSGATPMSEINMTPLIDVMLVLLVIFMISAPLMAGSLKLDLPKAAATTRSAAAAPPLALALNAQGQLFLAEEPVSLAQLQARAQAAARAEPGTEVLLRADQSVPYGRVAELIALLQGAGLSRIGFVTETPPTPPVPR
jgi:biopolymer transport protein TolR